MATKITQLAAAIVTLILSACDSRSNAPPVSGANTPPAQDIIDRSWEERGYLSFSSTAGDRLAIRRSDIEAAYRTICANRGNRPACDVRENYRLQVVADQWVNVFFLHKDRSQTQVLQAFVCTNQAPEWSCQAEQD